MASKTKQDRKGNEIGDGSFHSDYEVFEFTDYPSVSAKVDKSETTESVYVKYTNSLNNETITVRFSNHENNAMKFGDQLNGFLATRNEVLARLDLIDRVFIPDTYLSISNTQVKRSETHLYEESDLTIQEMYELGENADLSAHVGKRAKGSNRVIKGDKVQLLISTRQNAFGQSVQVGTYEYKAREPISNQKESIESLTDKFKEHLRIELKECSKGLYPLVCSLKDSERGFQEIFKNVYDICSKTGMGIDSALAQYESALN